MKLEHVYNVDYINPKTNVEIFPGVNISLLELLKRATYGGNGIDIRKFERTKSSEDPLYCYYKYNYDITLPTSVDIIDRNGVLEQRFVFIDLNGTLELVPNKIEARDNSYTCIGIGKMQYYGAHITVKCNDLNGGIEILYDDRINTGVEDALGTIFKNLIFNIDYWLMLETTK